MRKAALARKAAGVELTDEALAQIYAESEAQSEELHMNGGKMLTAQLPEATKPEGTRYTYVIRGVAVIGLIGPIFPRANLMTMSGATSLQTFMRDYNMMMENPGIKAIIIETDTPGGDARGLSEAAKQIYQNRGKKPQVGVTTGFNCSAGYFLTSALDSIVTDEGGIIGCIGTQLIVPTKPDPLEDGAVEFTSAQTPNKNPDPLSDTGRAHYQQLVDDVGQIFINAVAKFRGIKPADVLLNYGAGATYAAPRARQQGMVDKISTLSATVHLLATGRGVVSTIPPSEQQPLEEGTDISGPIASIDVREEMIMGLFDQFKTDHGEVAPAQSNNSSAQGQQQPTGGTAAAVTPPVAPPPTNMFEKPTTERIEALRKKHAPTALLEAERIALAGHIKPASIDNCAYSLVSAMVDDELYGGTVPYMSQGQEMEGTRLQQKKAEYYGMPKHTLAEESVTAIQNGTAQNPQVLPQAVVDKEKVPEVNASVVKRLFDSTEVGRIAAAEKAAREAGQLPPAPRAAGNGNFERNQY